MIIKETKFPVALKVLEIAHKSEQNAVALNLTDLCSVYETTKTFSMLGDKFYIEEMVQKPVLELLVGVTRDDQFGLVMTIATGGVMVEVFNDSQTLLLPFDKSAVEYKLRQLKSAVLFDGFRGRKRADFEATTQAILCIQEFAMENSERLNELDINPLIVCEQQLGAQAADVLIKFGRDDNE